MLPAIIAGAGQGARKRFLDFFTVNIRNPNTRAAYGRAAAAFLRWCEGRGIGALGQVEPVDVAAYIEHLGTRHEAALGQAASRLHPHAVRLAGHRPCGAGQPRPFRALASAFGQQGRHAGAVLRGGLGAARRHECLNHGRFARSRDYRGDDLHLRARRRGRGAERRGLLRQKKRWWLRLNEKNGKVHEMPCHHKLEAYLDAYIGKAGIAKDDKEPLFRVAIRKNQKAWAGADDAQGCLVYGAPPRGRRRHQDAHPLPHFPGHGNYGLPHKWWSDRGRSAHGRPFQRENHGPLRPAER
jgi:hypothetical protein